MSDIKQVLHDIERCSFLPDACGDCSKFTVNRNRCMEELMADAYALLKEQEWVSVKDRLPKSCGNYRVRVGKDGFNPHTKTAYWLAGKKVWKGAEAYSIITDVSHWMPLPEPPKEVSE